MNGEYKRKAPWLRLAIVIAALSITLSIGGFIDLLAFSYFADASDGQSATAVSANSSPVDAAVGEKRRPV